MTHPDTPPPTCGRELVSLSEMARTFGVGRRRLAAHVAAGNITPSLPNPATGRHLFHLPTVREHLARMAEPAT